MEIMLPGFSRAIRRLLGAPSYSLTVFAVLAVGLGANGAILTLDQSLLGLHLRGIEHPERLVALFSQSETQVWGSLSMPDFRDYRDRSRSLEDLAAYSRIRVALRGADPPGKLDGQIVTENYFSLLGLEVSRLGEAPPTDTPFSEGSQVVLARETWRQRFGADPEIVGRTLFLNGSPFTVVGLAPEEFQGTDPWQPTELWVPVAAHRTVWPGFPPHLLDHRGAQIVIGVGRLLDGVELARAREEIDSIGLTLESSGSVADSSWKPVLMPAGNGTMWPADRAEIVAILRTLRVASILLLLVVCLIAASLTLGRLMLRGSEVALRVALGAPRRRLLLDLAAESLILALCGGAGGVVLASWILRLLTRFPIIPPMAAAEGATLTPAVGLGVLVLSLVCCSLWALPVAGVILRGDLGQRLLGAHIRGASGTRHRRLHEAFVVAEVTFSAVLLVAAGLVVASWSRLAGCTLGFQTSAVVLFQLDAEPLSYTVEQERQLYSNLQDLVITLPAVEHAALAASIPLGRSRFARDLAHDPGGSAREDDRLNVTLNAVSPGYFETLGIPLLRGRDFDHRDRPEGRRTAVVTQALAERLWPKQDPLGQMFGLFDGERFQPVEVIGMVADSQTGRVLEQHPQLHLYLPLAQDHQTRATLLVKGRRGDSPVSAVRQALQSLHPDLAIERVVSMEDHVATATAKERSGTVLVGTAASISLILTGWAIFALIALLFAQTRNEIAVRMALGADRRKTIRRLVAHALLLSSLGLVPGLFLARFSEALLATWLTELDAPVGWIYPTVAGVVLVVAMVASWIPARRAADLDPAAVLRSP